MGFFLETHNGKYGFGGHFCDKQRDHGPSVLTGIARLIHVFDLNLTTQILIFPC